MFYVSEGGVGTFYKAFRKCIEGPGKVENSLVFVVIRDNSGADKTRTAERSSPDANVDCGVPNYHLAPLRFRLNLHTLYSSQRGSAHSRRSEDLFCRIAIIHQESPSPPSNMQPSE